MARELSETIVERAFVTLANGIAAELHRRDVWTGTEDQRQAIFSAARTVLYQLLFLFFAERRGLLPLTHPVYIKHSLHGLIQQIANQPFLPLHERHSLEVDDLWAWEYVQVLLLATQQGRPDWDVLRCGTVISSKSDIANVRIGARYLIQVLDLLGRDDDAREATTREKACQMRDYSALGVRLLGEVYERLLACELEETVHHRDTKAQRSLKKKHAVPLCLGGSTFVLCPTRAVRRASGSFYTPQYLVASLVQETIDPLMAERIAEFEVHPTAKTCAALLDLSLLDPAMGCGMFLLASVDLMVERLLELLNRFPVGPLATLLAEKRVSLGDDVSDMRLLRHLVLRHCIYGVDIDEQAVEIARLGLWLHCCVPGTSLDALDPQLRCGNSLIGGQMSVLEDSVFVVPSLSSQLLDVWASRALNGDSKVDLVALGETLARGHVPDADQQRMLDEAHLLAARHHFFHWELAFPAIFFDLVRQTRKRPDEAGFDAVIGNPPYVTTLNRQERVYLASRTATRGRELDACYLFVEQALRLMRCGGRCGMVLPSVWMLQSEAEPFRRHLLDQTIISLRDLGFTVFSATVPVATLVIAHSPPSSTHAITLRLRDGTEQMVQQAIFAALPAAQFNAQLAEMLPLLQRIKVISAPLDAYAESHEGVHSGNIRHKLFTRAPAPSAKSLLKGADIGRYNLQWGGWYVNYDPALIDRSAGEYASLRDERIFTRPKIWTRQTGDSIIATWDDQGFYSDNTLHVTQIRRDVDLAPLYLIALLNSRLLTFIYQQHTQERGRPLAQVKLVFLRQLPIRRIAFTTPQEERARLVADGIAVAMNWIEKRDTSIHGWIDARLASGPPDQSDAVHDLLVLLAERMLDFKRRHGVEIKIFLDWLAATTASRLDEWIGKRVLHTYWMHAWEVIERTLQRNGIMQIMPEQIQAIKARWEESCTALAPLDKIIQDTDRLIDLLVYRLYDLNDHEIALIEVGDSTVA